MPNTSEIPETPETIADTISIEWRLSDEVRNNLKNTLIKIFEKKGKVWGLISSDRKILLGNSNVAYSVSPEVPFRELSVSKIDNVPDEAKNETKHQVYAAFHHEPISLSEILQINLTNEEEMQLRKLLLDKVSKIVDEALG